MGDITCKLLRVRQLDYVFLSGTCGLMWVVLDKLNLFMKADVADHGAEITAFIRVHLLSITVRTAGLFIARALFRLLLIYFWIA